MRGRTNFALGLLAASGALGSLGMVSPDATNGPPPEPDMDPKEPTLSERHRRAGEKSRRELYKATRTKSDADVERISAAEAKRARKAAKRLGTLTLPHQARALREG